ncbi:MAG TPA: UMP kinase [Nitrosopumilaceae archaeon]|nr:UMP kinase [Nitrosopumilaceae archaeon]
MRKRIVIKLSGSLFGMEDEKILKDYATFFVRISKICQPIIIAGGGKIARHYITHARSSGADESTLDELGIEVSRLNAKLLIYAIQDKAYPHPPTNLKEVTHAADSGLIVITGGLHPGQSTNATAALIAEKVRASIFLNATDVDGVYDSDPNKNKNAKKFKRINLKKLRNMLVHQESIAGGYDLMDIVALKVIERSKIKTRIIKADVKTLEKAIKGSPEGTEIILT